MKQKGSAKLEQMKLKVNIMIKITISISPQEKKRQELLGELGSGHWKPRMPVLKLLAIHQCESKVIKYSGLGNLQLLFDVLIEILVPSSLWKKSILQ